MFESKEEIEKAVSVVLGLFRALNRGDILSHARIAVALGLKPHEGQWDVIMIKARRRLEEERGIALWPNYQGGYRLCTKKEQLQLPAERLKRGIRQVRRGRKSVVSLPTVGLTDHQRRAKLFHTERLLNAERQLRRELQDVQKGVQPSKTIPRRPAAVGT